ncbi:halocyanin [Haloarcula hispanica N601]|uniref:Halocyanin domain-containing protein n=3 Tax=Haloarcula hispanica TaxID=51589 RepID=A0A482TB95_HALHI|nr:MULTISPECIES: halocyanin domain-containing protein [Haloarcula]AEM56996.1 halocyanin precursor-like protein [Haloarcula hispanica ATCC 33960]AHB65787.1 halocyanin [Haloarcula hispanica N601]AJF26928.1 halocyanin [Haloarcula sp. CBA1115]KAA9409690.1 halocyanin domain-containing protein [Haloarcula hispanica]KZX48477.1 halocyanin [Haloarcula sp. K1]
MNRREFVRTAGGAAGAAATLSATGAAAAQEEGGDGAKTVPDYGGFLDSVGNFDGSTVDATGQDTVTVEVGVQANGGAYGFGPPAVHVDNGATVQFEWTGNGGGHNVVSDGDGPLDSGSTASSAGVNYEHTFEEDGIYPYLCVPHEGLNMKGAIVVGEEYPTQTIGGGGPVEVDPHYAGVPIQPHYVGFGAGLAVIIPLIFTFFQLKYGESPHTSGGNN